MVRNGRRYSAQLNCEKEGREFDMSDIVEESLHMLGTITYNLAENETSIPAKRVWNKT
jgi:hypothetical protein